MTTIAHARFGFHLSRQKFKVCHTPRSAAGFQGGRWKFYNLIGHFESDPSKVILQNSRYFDTFEVIKAHPSCGMVIQLKFSLFAQEPSALSQILNHVWTWKRWQGPR